MPYIFAPAKIPRFARNDTCFFYSQDLHWSHGLLSYDIAIEGQKNLDYPVILRHFCPINGTRHKKERKWNSRKEKNRGEPQLPSPVRCCRDQDEDGKDLLNPYLSSSLAKVRRSLPDCLAAAEILPPVLCKTCCR